MLLFSHCQLNIKIFIAADLFAKYVSGDYSLYIGLDHILYAAVCH